MMTRWACALFSTPAPVRDFHGWSKYDGNLLSSQDDDKCGYCKIITYMFSILLLFMIMMRVTTTILKMIVMLGCCKLIVWVSQDYDMQVFNIIVDDNDEVDNYDDEDDVGEDDCDAWKLQTNSVGIARSADH